MKIKFIGAAREVTGSKHLITTNSGKNILLDCGMFQGKGLETDNANRNLMFDPEQIDHIILTHAHVDHAGLIPYLYKMGFRGSVICSNATRDLCAIMLADCAFIQEHDTHTFNKRRAKKGLPIVSPLYTQDDAHKCMNLFIGVPNKMKFRIDENLKVKFTNTGHMLGSGVANMEITENGAVKRVAYTGDIGRPDGNSIISHPEPFPQADFLIAESTYGNRLHADNIAVEEELLSIIVDTCVRKRGKLIIPAFSVGRTQEVVYAIKNFFNKDRLPKVDVFVDSPLAINATSVFRAHPECCNKDFLESMKTDHNPFGFANLHYITHQQDSKNLNEHKGPCIIISASGMMEAGRVKHHLANNISSPKNTVLAVGYCAPTTLGSRILRGDREVSIHGTVYKVKAEIRSLDSFSGHADYNEMIQFFDCQDKAAIKKMFLVHGDYETQINYREFLKKSGFKNIEIPSQGQVFEI